MKAFADERRKRKVAKLAGCVFGKNRLYSMLWIGFGAQTATCNLATRLRFSSRLLVHICVVSSFSFSMFLVFSLLIFDAFAVFAL